MFMDEALFRFHYFVFKTGCAIFLAFELNVFAEIEYHKSMFDF